MSGRTGRGRPERLTFYHVPGVLVLQGMSLRIPAGSLVISIGAGGRLDSPPLVPHLRLDLWPTWLEIGCEHARRAHETASEFSSNLPDQDKADLLGRELQGAMVAMCAFAFAFDGFYDVVKSELGEHPDAAQWRQEGRRPTRSLTRCRGHGWCGDHAAPWAAV